MSGKMNQVPGTEWLNEQLQDLTPGDFLIELRRIADALESFTDSKKCYGVNEGRPCALPPDHVGHHVSADGRLHWLDKE